MSTIPHHACCGTTFQGTATRGEDIIKQGDLEAEHFYILGEGVCEIFKDGCVCL
jgi:hypothetical protein